MFGLIHRSAIVTLAVTTLGMTAHGQRAGTTGRDSIGDAAAALLNEGRTNEARMTLLRAMRGTTRPDLLVTYRLELGDTFVYEGKFQPASQAYNMVISGHDAAGVDSLVRWAHHGLALIDAFNGRLDRAVNHYADALKGRGTLADTIEMLVLTAQHDSAIKAIDRLVASRKDENALQFAQAYRGLSWMNAGHCTQALPEIAKAPHQDRPIPQAVRGRCASKHGQRVDALAIKDSVLKQHVPDPFAWSVLIARDVARKIQ
ncbi:MAG TPA: tetratricopeptide repeat protein [Gemmatimonadaceae bacterium]|jgi:tetratricopeptide (TPR) repeat protein